MIAVSLALSLTLCCYSQSAADPAPSPKKLDGNQLTGPTDKQLQRVEHLQGQILLEQQSMNKRLENQSADTKRVTEDALWKIELAKAAPTVLWLILAICVLVGLWKDLKKVAQLIVARLQQGSAVKLGSVELGAVVALPKHSQTSQFKRMARKDDGQRETERDKYYQQSRRVMLAHRLWHSKEEGEIYDILIYLVPAHSGSLLSVTKVEYFFGGHGWQNNIFTAFDRSHSFAILTAAYGPFLCTAQVTFNDETTFMLHRFIDFEMGDCVIPTHEPSK